MSIHEQTVAEFQRRVALLPVELAEWKAQTSHNVGGLGMHTSQIEAVTDFFEERIKRHNELMEELQAAPDAGKLAALRSELEDELGGAHGLMMVFRYLMSQRLDTDRYHDVLNAADLIAADCYRPRIALAVNWQVLKKGQFRVPPLTFLNARSSPQALTRQKTFNAFGFDLESAEMQVRLPFSFVSLRYHDTGSIWSFCSIYHEVGHLLDQDLDLEGALGEVLDNLPGDIDPQQVPFWKLWLKEWIADAFGVLLGGAGFAYALADILFLPPSEVAQAALDVHPPPYLRIYLQGALLRRIKVPELEQVAGKLEEDWKQIYGDPPPLQVPFLDACPGVAKLLLSTHLMQRLQNRRLRDLAPGLPQDHARALSLTLHLREGGPPPDPTTFPMRLVPAAARLAVRDVEQGQAGDYAEIHSRALAFIQSIPHDEIMAPGGLEAEQKTYLRELARSVRFSKPE